MKPSKFTHSRMLTPEELEALKQDMLEAERKMDAFLKEQDLHQPSPPQRKVIEKL